MRIRLDLVATLCAVGALTLAGAPAFASDANGARPSAAALRDGASDTGARPAVHGGAQASERRYCTPISCGGARASSASLALGFGLTALAAAWTARRRPAGSD